MNGVSSELKINDTLKEKLKREFNFILPELKENNNGPNFFINEYFTKVKKEITKSNHKWELKNWVSFGLYNTQNMCIHKDIEGIKQDIASHCEGSKLGKILLGQKITESEVNEEYNVDNEEYRQELPALVESADASQYSAVLDVLKETDIVIKGPPGTGKSQTITNIISTLISNGKKVLFVAQKQAALDVVRNKLQANGLGNYILEVFSAKANKKMIMESMKRRFNSRNKESDISEQLSQTINRLWRTKEKLNKYAEFMSKKFKNTGFTIHEIIWNHKPIKNIKSFKINSVETLSRGSIEDNIRSLHNIKTLYPSNLPSLKESPFLKIKKLPHIHDDFYSIEQEISSFYEKTQSLLKEKEDIFKKNSSLKNIDKIVLNHPLVKGWIALNKEKEQSKKYLDSFKVAFNISSEELMFYLKSEEEYIRTSKTNAEDKKRISSFCKLENLPDLSLIKEASLALEKEHIPYVFSEEWQKAKQIFKSLYIGQEKLIFLQEIKTVLNNEEEIFPENGDDTLINNIVNTADSEELKNYLKSKEEYIEIEKKNIENKKYISTFCDLENTPELSTIKEASLALEKEHISDVFSEEWQKAKKIFKSLYIGQEKLISLQEIKTVLNNKEEIFLKNDNTLINNIVYSTDSEILKSYIKSKEEYIRTASANTEDKKYISSFCNLENTPELSTIKETSLALEKEHISDVFSEEWQKAKKIFKNLYIGQEKLISLQEIKTVLNNKEEIFLKNDNTLIDNIIYSANSEDLKSYVKSKTKHIKTSRINAEHKKRISSVCKLENLPELSIIEKTAQTLKKGNIFSIFSSENRKAHKIFRQIYIGKRGLYSKHNILTQLCYYLKSRSTDEQREIEYKKQTDVFYKKLQNIIGDVKQNNSASDILNKLYQYLESRPANEQR
ncbi:MAG: AAA domain-containing protein, partial [Bdellovibrionales bacterium]|nr:AAA domain-containing protein [Bdellovibrionales bacterium]